MAEFDPATLNPEQCPAPDFSALATATKNALCNIDRRALERDQALMTAHQALVGKVDSLDEGNVAEIIARISDFIAAVDKDGDGNIDGLTNLVKANEGLAVRVATLEESAKLTEKKLVAVQESQATTQTTLERHSSEIAALKNREDKVGVTEERVTEIAGDVVCKSVLKPLQLAVTNFAAAMNAIDCGEAGHTAFMSGLTGATAAPAADVSTDGGTDPVAAETDGESATDAPAELAIEAPAPEDDNPAADVLG